MVSVALSVGERPDVAYVLPLSVDGMLVVASVAMVDDRRNFRRVRWSARFAFVAGVVASVAANVAAALPTVGARIVAAWPAVALLLTVELLSRTGRLLTRSAAALDASDALAADPAVAPAAVASPAVASPTVAQPAAVGPVPVRPAAEAPRAAPVAAGATDMRVMPEWEPATYSLEESVTGPSRSYVDDVTPLATPRRGAPAVPDPFPTPVSPAVSPAPTTLPSSTRIAVAQALPPAGPTAARHASERRARAAQSPSGTTRTSARVSSARPRQPADDAQA
jgi:hypothetical protein